MQIEPGNNYRIKGISKYFLRKYNTSNPIITILNPIDAEKEGHNPAGFLFLGRIYAEGLPVAPAWYGHIDPDGRGEIVCQPPSAKADGLSLAPPQKGVRDVRLVDDSRREGGNLEDFTQTRVTV